MSQSRTAAASLRSDKFAEKIALAVSRSSVDAHGPAVRPLEEQVEDGIVGAEERPIVHIYTSVLNPPEVPPTGPLILDPVLTSEPPMKLKPAPDAAPVARPTPTREIDLRANEASLLQASVQLLETQVGELDQVVNRLELENDRLRRENQSLVRLLTKLDHPPLAGPRQGSLFDWMRGLRLRSATR